VIPIYHSNSISLTHLTKHLLITYSYLLEMASVHPRSNKNTWSPEEDVALVHLVEIHGSNNWTVIAQELGGKRSKQCRERYHNHLQSNIQKGGWTKEEEQRIFELHGLYGNQWAKIAEFFPTRTDNSIKNRYNSMMRSIQHKQLKQQRKAAEAVRKHEQQSPLAIASNDTTTLSEPSCTSSLSTISDEHVYKRHPLVPALSLFGSKQQNSEGETRSEGCVSFRLNFSTTGSLLDMTQFTVDSDSLETFRSSSSFEMLRQLLNDTDDSSSDEDIPEDWCVEDCINQYPFSARVDEVDSSSVTISPFSARLDDDEATKCEEEERDQFVLSPWWEERDLLLELGNVMENIEISPRIVAAPMPPAGKVSGKASPLKLSPHTTPRSPFLANLKRLKRSV